MSDSINDHPWHTPLIPHADAKKYLVPASTDSQASRQTRSFSPFLQLHPSVTRRSLPTVTLSANKSLISQTICIITVLDHTQYLPHRVQLDPSNLDRNSSSNKFKSIQLREERIHGVSLPEFITASALATSLLPRPSALDSFRPPSVLQVLDLPSFTTAQSIDERPSLPSIGHDISRPSSTSTQSSSVHPYSLQRHGSNSSLQLPGLSALASIASSSPAASNSPNNSHHSNTPNR